jgi:hypothetical protein
MDRYRLAGLDRTLGTLVQTGETGIAELGLDASDAANQREGVS